MSKSDAYLHDYMKDIENSKTRFGFSSMNFTQLLRYFNISKLPDYDNATEPYIAYIIMSRPSINFDDNNIAALKADARTAAFMNDAYGYNLMRQLSTNADSVYLPIVTTRAMSYSVNDITMKTIEKGNTYYGHVLHYGRHTEDHKIGGTFSIDFRNDRFLSILKMMYLWTAYYQIASKTGAVAPTMDDQANGILDYAGSLYYLITRRNGRELVYWEKATGVFPLSVPFSIFSSSDNLIVEDKITIEFSYGIKSDPCDPSVLMDINYLSGLSSSTIESKTKNGISQEAFLNNKETPFVLGDVYSDYPFIHMNKSTNGFLTYDLQFHKAT